MLLSLLYVSTKSSLFCSLYNYSDAVWDFLWFQVRIRHIKLLVTLINLVIDCRQIILKFSDNAINILLDEPFGRIFS